jgi:hypothetical protein
MSRRYWKKKSDTTSSIFELIYFINRRRISGQDITTGLQANNSQ